MQLNLFVREVQSSQTVPVKVVPASDADLKQTASAGWQTSWNTRAARQFPNRVALKTETDELLGLMSYAADEKFMAVEVVYLESQPESNPTLTKQKKYQGIGKAMIAFGIQLSIDANCNGVVVFEAKTDELERHYIQDLGARPVASLYPDGPKTFMIADQAAKDIFSSYLF